MIRRNYQLVNDSIIKITRYAVSLLLAGKAHILVWMCLAFLTLGSCGAPSYDLTNQVGDGDDVDNSVVHLDAKVTSNNRLSVDASFVLNFETNSVEYRLVFMGIQEEAILAIDMHERSEDSQSGPLLRWLSARQAILGDRFILTGREMRLLQESRLYVDVHTLLDPGGALRIDLSLPKLK